MPDVFDSIEPTKPKDIFDSVSGDVFDTVASAPTAAAPQEPSMGQVAAGAALEVGAGVTGEVTGLALAPLTFGISYPVAKFVSGVGGSLAAQEIEGRDQMSYGRALAAGLMNLIPGAALGKGAKALAVVGKEAARGAAIGAGESVVTSLIDEQRAPTAEELGGRVLGGAVGGGVLGGALKGGSALIAAAKPSELFPALSNVGQKLKAAAAPSTVVGREIQDVAISGKNEAAAAAELGSRVARQVDTVLSKQPNSEAAKTALNDYLDGKIDKLPASLQSLSGDIDVAKEKLNELQGKLLHNIDVGYTSASDELRQKIDNSIKSGNYLTREYEFFTNAKYKPTEAQREAAIGELVASNLSEAAAAGRTMSLNEARSEAESYLSKLDGKKLSIIKNGDYYPSSLDGFLKERKEVGPSLRSYLGEITDPGERLRGTLTRVSRGVYRDEMDGNIFSILQKNGMVSTTPDDFYSAELKLRKFQPETKVYVNPAVQDALSEMYLGKGADDTSNFLVKGMSDFWNTAVGLSKASKVLLNPPSYLVQTYSNAANIAGMGINPFSGAGKGLRIALAEYGPLEQITKNPEARKALLKDIQEATKYGIKGANILDSDVRDSIERGFFSESLQKGLGFFSKAYTVADNAGRFVAWKGNQKLIERAFPGSDPELVKRVAANWTNDTYQNYDRLSGFVKRLSRAGVMPQFAAFTMEFARNQYNQGKLIRQMLNGTLGEGTGLAAADLTQLRKEGMKRLAALATVYGSTAAAISGINSKNGIDSEKEKALKETVLGDWVANNKLAIMMNEDGTGGKYVDPSYIIPHTTALSAFQAGLNDQPIDSLASVLSDELVGEGSFVGRSLYASLFNIDPKSGKPISYQTDKAKNVSDRIAFAVKDAFEPGVSREVERLGKAMRGEGTLSTEDVLKRQVGIRLNDFTIEDGAKMKLRKPIDNVKLAAADYNAARDYRQLAPAQLEVVYQNANNARTDALNKIAAHAKNLKTLGFDDEKITTMLKDTGLSSKDILGVLFGSYEPLPREKVTTPTEIYSQISTLPKKEQIKAISEVAKTDVPMYKKLMEKYRTENKLEARGITPIDKLVMTLGEDDGERAKFINRATANMDSVAAQDYLKQLRKKMILTPKVEMQLKVYK